MRTKWGCVRFLRCRVVTSCYVLPSRPCLFANKHVVAIWPTLHNSAVEVRSLDCQPIFDTEGFSTTCRRCSPSGNFAWKSGWSSTRFWSPRFCWLLGWANWFIARFPFYQGCSGSLEVNDSHKGWKWVIYLANIPPLTSPAARNWPKASKLVHAEYQKGLIPFDWNETSGY